MRPPDAGCLFLTSQEMEGDAKALLEIMTCVAVSMTYARFVSSSIQPGTLRLVSLLPVVILLPFLPWQLHSIHLRGITAFFLAWLGVFKLLLLSFGLGPLSPSLPHPTFLAVSSLPVKLLHSEPPPHYICRLLLSSLVRSILLFAVISTYEYKAILFHHYLFVLAYCLHMYLALELVLACASLFVRAVLGLDLEPHFDAPHKSASLADFWGRRWNLTVTGILRPSVYIPVSAVWGPTGGVMATFLVSGLMHEAMFWYLTTAGPTGEVTCFFLHHGTCVVVEGTWRRRRKGWWRPGPMVTVAATVGFVSGTAYLLFLPPLLRNVSEWILLEESAAAVRLLEECVRTLLSWVAGWEQEESSSSILKCELPFPSAQECK